MMHPRQIGKYSIVGVLGQGAMGVVYRGFDPLIRRPVAIKTIQKSLIADDTERAALAARFRNEAQAVGRMSHPGVVQIYEYGQDGDTAFIAMEYVEGVNADKLMRGRAPLPEAEVLSVIDQLLDALDCAHHQGVWHRDVKPGNVLIGREGQVKLTDFGIARIENLALTQVASAIGTPGYMAPEQYTGQGLSHKVDLFATGVLLYRMLTGEAPFSGATQEEVMYKILHEDPVPPSEVEGSQCPVFYDRLISWALAKSPEQRIPTAAAFRQALVARGLAPVRPRPAMQAPDDDATVVRPQRAAPSVAGSGQSSGAGAATGTDPSVMAEVERELATVMGPIAKAIVRRAARTCPDAESLRHAVAQHITDERERAQFLAGTPAPKAARTVFALRAGTPRPAPNPTPTPRPSGSSDALTDAMIAAALPVLIEVMGPIAKLIVKKAAAQAATQAQFAKAIADAVDAPDRPKVLAALQRL